MADSNSKCKKIPYFDFFFTTCDIHVFGGRRGGIKRENTEEALFPSHNSASTATPRSRLGSSGL
jgi:hypothetical protein